MLSYLKASIGRVWCGSFCCSFLAMGLIHDLVGAAEECETRKGELTKKHLSPQEFWEVPRTTFTPIS